MDLILEIYYSYVREVFLLVNYYLRVVALLQSGARSLFPS